MTPERLKLLVVGRTSVLAENLKHFVANHLTDDVLLDARSYASAVGECQKNTPTPMYQAIFVEIEKNAALNESIYLIEGLRAENSRSIIIVINCGPKSNRMRYFISGADYCLSGLPSAASAPPELASLFDNPAWIYPLHLQIDQTRMCIVGMHDRQDISFSEMKVLEALSRSSNHLLSHNEIATIIGFNTRYYDQRAMEKSISRLRGKIKAKFGVNALYNVRGYGYRLVRGLITLT